MVYLATYGICNKQYVGNTTQALRMRVTGHRNGKNSALKEHIKFHENAGFNEVFIFSVITQTTTENILDVETKWIHKMRSSEPFGLNIYFHVISLNRVDPCALHTGIPT